MSDHIPDARKKALIYCDNFEITLVCVDCLEVIQEDEEYTEGAFSDGEPFYTCERCVGINAQGVEDANCSVGVGE